MRERFDAGTGLVAVGAVLLLVSLFIDWYKPGGDAWVVFEWLDVALAGAAIACLFGIAPRFTGLGRAVPVIALSRARRRDRPADLAAARRARLRPGLGRVARPRRHRADGPRRLAGRREHLGHRRRARARAPPAHRRDRRARAHLRRAARGGVRPGRPRAREHRGARRRAPAPAAASRSRRRRRPGPSRSTSPSPSGPAEVAEDPQRTQAIEPVDRTEPA